MLFNVRPGVFYVFEILKYLILSLSLRKVTNYLCYSVDRKTVEWHSLEHSSLILRFTFIRIDQSFRNVLHICFCVLIIEEKRGNVEVRQ